MQFTAVRLAKLGYYNGDIETILKTPISMILLILEYEDFQSEYQKAFDALNKGK